jgi:hypothetical protein
VDGDKKRGSVITFEMHCESTLARRYRHNER